MPQEYQRFQTRYSSRHSAMTGVVQRSQCCGVCAWPRPWLGSLSGRNAAQAADGAAQLGSGGGHRDRSSHGKSPAGPSAVKVHTARQYVDAARPRAGPLPPLIPDELCESMLASIESPAGPDLELYGMRFALQSIQVCRLRSHYTRASFTSSLLHVNSRVRANLVLLAHARA